jgi:hypothetical protein
MRSAGFPLAIVMTAVAVITLVGPLGNFPLSDDWSYAHVARGLCREGSIDLLPWTGASLIAQAAYGALVCKLVGFSFDALRASTLVLAVLGILVLDRLLVHLRVGGAVRALTLVTVGLSPLYVNLAFTFMTDLPFTVTVLACVYCYALALDDDRPGMLACGAALAAVSLLIRQHGAVVAAAAALAFLMAHGRPLRVRVRDAAIACATPLLALLVYTLWLVPSAGVPAAVTNKITEAGAASVVGTANIAFRAVETLGLALLPLALASLPRVWRRRRIVFLAGTAALAAVGVFLYGREQALMFYLTNVQYDLGVGALTLRDVLFLGEPPPYSLGLLFRVSLTAAATVGAAAGVAALSDRPRLDRPRSHSFLLLAACALAASSLLHTAFYFDRYLLPMLPIAATVLAVGASDRGSESAANARPIAAAWIAAALLSCFAVAGTHDYMAWNRARYDLLDELEADGVGAERIDGGMEFNAWRLAAKLGTWPARSEVVPGTHDDSKSWWWVVDDEFIVSFRPLPGYSVRGRRGYPAWLRPGGGEILVLERDDT